MLKRSIDSLRVLCHKRIAACCDIANLPAEFENRVVRLVSENIAIGRFERFLAGSARRSAAARAKYVDAIIYHTRQEATRVSALERGDAAAWNQLRDELIHRAYRMVQHFRQGDPDPAAALEFAQQTCLVIFDQRYPFDVSFDAWATAILKNIVLQHYTRSSDVLHHPHAPQSLDQPIGGASGASFALGDSIPDSQSRVPFDQIENQISLFDALNRLKSAAQQQVILWSFFDGLDDVEIARRLNKSKQAVYNLRQRALRRLKKIFQTPCKKSH